MLNTNDKTSLLFTIVEQIPISKKRKKLYHKCGNLARGHVRIDKNSNNIMLISTVPRKYWGIPSVGINPPNKVNINTR